MRHRRKLLVLLAVWALWVAISRGPELWSRIAGVEPAAGDAAVEVAFENRQSDLMLEVAGTVTRELADDNEGSRHQRFIVRLDSGRTLLISHNIDLAPRVPLAEGDAVEVRGEYEWNERGGLLHWTHHDPRGRRPGGWIRHRGETYR